ncbi:hypothetical protein [Saccharopolyspora sp. 5N708]|uniref:hypothetical protein n=1 Tax=Saccharopolyspora sp. 5N708 TaxID=3457424 RepID=UPI003FD48A21
MSGLLVLAGVAWTVHVVVVVRDQIISRIDYMENSLTHSLEAHSLQGNVSQIRRAKGDD